MSFPAGALAAPTTVSVQPIENRAHGGSGVAYRLSPHGVTFAQPVRLRFRYTDDDVDGTPAQLLRVAFQDAEGRWRMFREPEVDEASKTVSVRTTRFSDWSLVQGANLLPATATLKPGQSLTLKVKDCLLPPLTSDLLSPLVYECKDGFYALVAGDWYVNGIVGGGSAIGTITPSDRPAGSAVYQAPRNVARTTTVAASVEYFGSLSRERGLLVSRITILGDCADLADVEEWTGSFGVRYSFTGPTFGVAHAAGVTSQLRRAIVRADTVVWQGELAGTVSVDDWMGAGAHRITYQASGAPLVIGPGRYGAHVNAYLKLDLKRCTYRFWLEPAIMVTATYPVVPPRSEQAMLLMGRVVSGSRPVDGAVLAGEDGFPGQLLALDGDDVDMYQPVGGAGMLVGAGGTASVRWTIRKGP
jgi:hypothetical protein